MGEAMGMEKIVVEEMAKRLCLMSCIFLAKRVDVSIKPSHYSKLKVRNNVEHVFLAILRIFGFCKARYSGLAKNAN
jgi:hypothetical protein